VLIEPINWQRPQPPPDVGKVKMTTPGAPEDVTFIVGKLGLLGGASQQSNAGMLLHESPLPLQLVPAQYLIVYWLVACRTAASSAKQRLNFIVSAKRGRRYSSTICGNATHYVPRVD
jgi:hypothetical protein